VTPFISKLNSTGSGLVYSTLLGGARDETGLDVVVDATGAAYVTGSTSSPDFPTAPGALFNSGGCGFIAKITSRPPACAVLALLSGPPAQITATVHADRGLSSVVASSTVNTTVAVSNFAKGATTPRSPPLKSTLTPGQPSPCGLLI
jgi:hypothetical protein